MNKHKKYLQDMTRKFKKVNKLLKKLKENNYNMNNYFN